MKKLIVKTKENGEAAIVAGLMVGFIGLVIYNSIVYGTYSSPW
jgi:hypothetical protein